MEEGSGSSGMATTEEVIPGPSGLEIALLILAIVIIVGIISAVIYIYYKKNKKQTQQVLANTPQYANIGLNGEYLSNPVPQVANYNVHYGGSGGGGGGGSGGGGATSNPSTQAQASSQISCTFSVTFPSLTLATLDPNFVSNYNTLIANITGVPTSALVTSAPVVGPAPNNTGVTVTTTITDPNASQVSDFNNLYTALQVPTTTFATLLPSNPSAGAAGGAAVTPQVTYTSGIGPNAVINYNFTVTFPSGTLSAINQSTFITQYTALIAGITGVPVSSVTVTLTSGSIIATTIVSISPNKLTATTNPSVITSYNNLIRALQSPTTTFAPLATAITTTSLSSPTLSNTSNVITMAAPGAGAAGGAAAAAQAPAHEVVPQSAILDESPATVSGATAIVSATSVVPTVSKNTANTKKGFVAGTGDPTAGVKITNLNASWYYTWGAAPPSLIGQPPGIKFTPMIWNLSKISIPGATAGTIAAAQAVVASLKNLTQATTENIILTYNEPDGIHPSAQGNMLVGDGVSFWPNIINATVSTYTTPPLIGSPVMYGDTVAGDGEAPGVGTNKNNLPQLTSAQLTAQFPAGTAPGTYIVNISNSTTTPNNVNLNPLIWLDNFLIQVAIDYKTNPSKYTKRGPFPDFICIHWYGKPNATTLTGYLASVNAKYNLPIWITEYSCADWTATCCSPATAHTAGYDWSYPTDATAGTATNPYSIPTNTTALFMEQTVNWMNSQAYIQRYSWKERYLLVPNTFSTVPASITNTTNQYCPVSGGCPTDTSSSIISTTNPDYMGQSALFNSYEHFPTVMPPLTPLGKLYSSL